MIKIVNKPIRTYEVKKMAEESFGNLVKAVVDVETGLMAIGGELHADEEALLLTKGSKQENLWGINIYPDETSENMIEFDSMVNLRPSLGNSSRGVDNPETREKIVKIVNKLIVK